MTRTLILITALLLITACADSQDPTASPTSAAQPDLTPSPTSTQSPQPTSTATPEPTATPQPTAAHTPAPQALFIENEDCESISRETLRVIPVAIFDGEHSVIVDAELAETTSEQSQGLMCRSAVPENSGMLFTFAAPRGGGFWMFNTYVPLDIIYAAENGDVDIVQMSPCTHGASETLEQWRARCGDESAEYRAAFNYTAALELPQGWLESLGFDTEDPSNISISY